MENYKITIKPAIIFAFVKTLPLIIAALFLLFLAWRVSPFFLLFSFLLTGFSFYRFFYIRATLYIITIGYIRINRGIFFKRTEQVELFRLKDFIITRPFILQLFRLMDLTLKGTDPENPILYLRGIPDSTLIDTLRELVQSARQGNRIYEIN